MSINLQFEILNFKKEQGQTMFELIVALGVGVLVITAVVKMATVSVKNAIFAKSQAEATRYSQEGLEWLRLERNKDPAAFETRANKTWCLTTYSGGNPVWPATDGSCADTSLIAGKYTREVLLTSQTVGGAALIEARMTVSWKDANGKHQSYLNVRLSDNNFVLTLTSPAATPSLAPSPIPSPSPSNLLANGGFENDLDNWSVSPSTTGSGEADAILGSTAHEGAKSVEMYARVPDSQSTAIVDLIHGSVVVSAGTYCASAWVDKVSDARAGFSFYASGFTTQNPQSTLGWQRLNSTATFSQSTSVTVRFQLRGFRQRNYDVLVDEVSLVQGACP